MANDQRASLSSGGYAAGQLLISEEDLQARIRALGREITTDYAGRAPLLVGVLKGAFMFMSDLARAIDLPVEFDFMAVSSYGHSTRSSGVVRIVKDLDLDLADRDVIIVEDIIDSGLIPIDFSKVLLKSSRYKIVACAARKLEKAQQCVNDFDISLINAYSSYDDVCTIPMLT